MHEPGNNQVEGAGYVKARRRVAHRYKISKRGESTDSESGFLGTGAWGVGNNCFLGVRSPLGMLHMFWNWLEVVGCTNIEIY